MPMPPIPTKWMGAISRGSRMFGSLASSSAKADDPVFGEPRNSNQPLGVLDAPLSRGMTRGNFVCNRLDSGDFRDQIGQPFGGIEPPHGAGAGGPPGEA